MANPAEQLASLAKANFVLCTRLARIAGEEGEECLRIGGKAMFAAVDSGRAAAMSAVPSGGPFDFLVEVRKGQQRIAGDIARALEDWQRSWMAAAALPDTETGLAGFGQPFMPWFTRPAGEPS